MIRPLFDNVLLEKEKVSQQTTSGIILSTKQVETKYGFVVAMGSGELPDGKKMNMPFKIGDKVLYKTYGGQELKEEDKEYLLISAGSILAVIE
jgi:chaperonin GroES